MAHLATIVHLTDMHLMVQQDGSRAPLPDLNFRTRLCKLARNCESLPDGLRELAAGINHHDGEALEALVNTLPAVVAACNGPVVLIQSGDVESLGLRDDLDGGGHSHPGFDFLQSRVWPLLEAQCERLAVVELFGNHDVWPGLPPFAAIRKHADGVAAIASRREFRVPIPDLAATIETGANPVQIYRLNTVPHGVVTQVLATGALDAHLPDGNAYPLSETRNALRELRALAQASDRSAPGMFPVRVIAMHHPPHPFDMPALSQGRWTDGRLIGAELLSWHLSENGVHLVVAGHRHLLNPPQPDTATPLPVSGLRQDPLPRGIVQLVAESPTQDRDGNPNQTVGFCVYALRVDEAGTSLTVDRTVYRYEEGDLEFQPFGDTLSISGIELQ